MLPLAVLCRHSRNCCAPLQVSPAGSTVADAHHAASAISNFMRWWNEGVVLLSEPTAAAGVRGASPIGRGPSVVDIWGNMLSQAQGACPSSASATAAAGGRLGRQCPSVPVDGSGGDSDAAAVLRSIDTSGTIMGRTCMLHHTGGGGGGGGGLCALWHPDVVPSNVDFAVYRHSLRECGGDDVMSGGGQAAFPSTLIHFWDQERQPTMLQWQGRVPFQLCEELSRTNAWYSARATAAATGSARPSQAGVSTHWKPAVVDTADRSCGAVCRDDSATASSTVGAEGEALPSTGTGTGSDAMAVLRARFAALHEPTFGALRQAISGGAPAGVRDGAAWPGSAALEALLFDYSLLHARIRRGDAPFRVWILHCERQGEPSFRQECGGLGARMLAVRLALYLSILTGRALFIDGLNSQPLEDALVPARIDWRMSSSIRARVQALRAAAAAAVSPGAAGSSAGSESRSDYTRLLMLFPYDVGAELAFVDAAFSGAAVVDLYSYHFFVKTLAAQTLHHICSDRDGGDGGDSSGRHCCSAHAWRIVFNRERPLAVQSALDFLFRPSLLFIHEALLPTLARMPAWTATTGASAVALRLGVHLRTYAAEQERERCVCGRAQRCRPRRAGC